MTREEAEVQLTPYATDTIRLHLESYTKWFVGVVRLADPIDLNWLSNETINLWMQNPTTPVLTFDLYHCSSCSTRKWLFKYDSEKINRVYHSVCEECRKRHEKFKMVVLEVKDLDVQTALRNGPQHIMISRTECASRKDAAEAYPWNANTPIEFIFFIKNKTEKGFSTLGATKELAVYAFAMYAPSIAGVLDRRQGVDVLKPHQWYHAFTAANPTLMQDLEELEDSESDDTTEDSDE